MSKTAALLAFTVLGTAVASAQSSLGIAADYNVFVRNNFWSQYSDTEGRVAVGGNFTVDGYATGLKTEGSQVLVVGGNLNYSNGTIHGTAKYGGSANLSSIGLPYGAPTQGSVIDFGAAFTDLTARSTQWASLSSTGTAVQTYSTLNFTGSSSGLNIFNITAADLNRGDLYQVKFNLPAGAKALVNVSGLTGNFRNIGYDNYAASDVLWNFPTATSITNSSFKGSLLAPNADVVGGWGAIDGQLIAKSFYGNTQINNYAFTGTIPYGSPQAVPEPGTIAALGLGAAAALRRRKARKA